MMYYNEQTERAVLGEMMLRNKFFESLSESDFGNENHKILFGEIKRRHAAGKPFTIIDLQDFSKSNFGNMDHAVMEHEATNYFIPGMTLRELKLLTEKRALERVLSDAQRILATGSTDDVVQEIESKLLQIALEGEAAEADRASDKIHEALSDIEAIYQRKGELSGIPTSFPTINTLLDGFQKSDYVIVAARPSMGKTAIANQFMMAACRNSYKVGFFSAEMPAKKILQRMICSIAGVSLQQIRSGNMTAGQFHDLNRASEEISGFDLFINDTPNIEISRLRLEAKRMRRKQGIDLLVIDYLGLISSKAHERNSIYERVTAISRLLKQLSRELEIPVVVLAQINRDAEDKEPKLSNLRDSGAIEQDADTIMILHRRGESENSAMDLIVAKHRNGPTGRAGIAFDRELQKFSEFREP
jgi:replicative DNA helicase